MFLLTLSGAAKGEDRNGFVGASGGWSRQLQPTKQWNDPLFAMDFGVLFSELWGSNASFDFALGESNRISLSFGPMLYFARDFALKPFVYANFIYLLEPTHDIGWRGGVGLEWNLVRLTGQDNLRLYVMSGVHQIMISKAKDEFALDAVRAGLAWNY